LPAMSLQKFTHEYFRYRQNKLKESKEVELFHKDKCFLAISINNRDIGEVVVKLYTEELPRTCANFQALCTGEKGKGKIWKKPLHYKGCKFHRVIPRFMIQGGDFSHGDGRGGESIYGETFADEGFLYKHDRPGLVSMANSGVNANSSQFFITLAPAPHLDGLHVIFGEIIKGMDIVRLMEQVETSESNKPKMPIKISDCGLLPIRADAAIPVEDDDLPPEEKLRNEEARQMQVMDGLVASVQKSVQSALARGQKQPAIECTLEDDEGDEDPAVPPPAKKLKPLMSTGKGMLSLADAVEDASDSDEG